MSDERITIDLTDLSPRCRWDALAAIRKVADDNRKRICIDLKHYADGDGDGESPARQDMERWRDGASRLALDCTDKMRDC